MLPKNVEDLFPLTPMQRLMLLHAVAEGGNGVLLNQVCYDIRGDLDADAFRAAWEALLARHAALRTAFLWEGLPQPLQAVRTVAKLPYRSVDLSHLDAERQAEAIESLRREDAGTPMVLEKAPLMRCTLVRLGEAHHRFMWAVHHLVVDRWSHGILFADLRTLYAAHRSGETPRLPPAAPFRDYVAWIGRQERGAAERFWRAELAGVRAPTLLAREGGVRRSGARPTARRLVSRQTSAAVRATASRWRTTPAALLLASAGLLAARRTGSDDVVCGVTVSGRPPELEEGAAIVGSLVNNLPARMTLQRERAVEEWVRDVHRAQSRREEFAFASLADIHDWSDAPRPLFDTLVLLNLTDDSQGEWPGVEMVADAATLDAGFPLVLSVTTSDEGLRLSLVHDEWLGDAAGLLAEFEAVLARVATSATGTTVGDLIPAPAALRTSNGASPKPSGAPEAGPSAVGATTAYALLAAWREVLGVEEVGLDDDFFAVGGSSLQAAQLFARIERIVGRSLPLSTLLRAGSVRALLAELDRPAVPRSGSLVLLRSAGSGAPLYVVPGIGGNVVGLSALARHLGTDRPFGAFESPGLDGREAPLSSIEAIADRYAGELARTEASSHHLLGVCWGAAVAFEMARRLTEGGRPPSSLLLLDPAVLLRETGARSAPAEASFLRGRLELYWDEFRGGDWRDRSRLLASKAKRAAQVLTGGEALEQSQGELNRVRVREANKDAVTRYLPRPLAARAHIFLTADRDVGGGDDPRLEWLTLITPKPEVVVVGGADSGDAISPAHVAGLASALRQWLAAADDVP